MQFCLKLNISQSGRVQPVVRCHVRIRALRHLKPPPSPLPPCHLSAVTLLDPSPSSCLCTKCLRIPLVFSKPRARYMAAYGSSRSTQPFLTCTDTPGQTRPFKFIFSPFFFLLPRVSANVYPSLERVHRRFQPWDDCSFVFRYFSSCPRRDYGELGGGRGGEAVLLPFVLYGSG